MEQNVKSSELAYSHWKDRVFYVCGKKLFGSGVLLNQKRIFTVAHLGFELNGQVEVSNTKCGTILARCIHICKVYDFAILESDQLPDKMVIHEVLDKGREYCIMGYPRMAKNDSPSITQGMVENMHSDNIHFIGTPGARRGYSGGPVVTKGNGFYGLLIGGIDSLTPNSSFQDAFDGFSEQKSVRILPYAAIVSALTVGTTDMETDKDAIITDQLNHASIIDGIRLSKAKRHVFNHMDMQDLEQKLKETEVAPLKEIFALADKYNALIFLDECHSTGFMGKTGRGTEEALELGNRADIINSTLGKALGGAMGGYTVGPKPLIDLLRQRSRPYLFSNSLAPSVVGSALKVLDLLSQNNSFVANLHTNVERFRTKMSKLGFQVMGDKRHPICPVFLGDAALASKFSDEMLTEGIYVIGFSFPVVPKGKARIRVQISAAHSTQQIDSCVDAFEKIGKKLNVIS